MLKNKHSATEHQLAKNHSEHSIKHANTLKILSEHFSNRIATHWKPLRTPVAVLLWTFFSLRKHHSHFHQEMHKSCWLDWTVSWIHEIHISWIHFSVHFWIEGLKGFVLYDRGFWWVVFLFCLWTVMKIIADVTLNGSEFFISLEVTILMLPVCLKKQQFPFLWNQNIRSKLLQVFPHHLFPVSQESLW